MDQFHKIYARVISNLEKNLPSWLHYHSAAHTRHVLDQTIFIAGKEHVKGEDLFLLKLAALYHDTGFMKSREKHEEISCSIAHKELVNDGLEKEDVDKVCKMILATRIPQKPETKLENIIADADLEYLGTPQFNAISNRLYKELLHYHPNMSREQWNEIQIDFISKHSYHTNYCKQNREPGKLANLEHIKKEVRKQS
ncbi:HD domain-containing protein [Zunongwangia sp. F363]|uniref:HD domain-containing protein n=1 Tax=Autumnicola tepida TaxID=3075595 RepID=A0ABU3CAU3_9FLAO|nr:HD domain-containing protein [Zunongwangia sp. F363]MDT0643455.1 HD domain-containing protein [Zunongwangia sp. F363]